jgi:hypothetical protein
VPADWGTENEATGWKKILRYSVWKLQMNREDLELSLRVQQTGITDSILLRYDIALLGNWLSTFLRENGAFETSGSIYPVIRRQFQNNCCFHRIAVKVFQLAISFNFYVLCTYSVVIRLRDGGSGVLSLVAARNFNCSLKRPDRLWGRRSLLLNGHMKVLPIS